MDLSKLSDADLIALQRGDLSKVSDAGLAVLSGKPITRTPDAFDRQVMEGAKINPVLKAGAEVLGGATSLMRDGANIVGKAFSGTKWGDKIWPTEGLDKSSLAYTIGEIADPVSLAVGGVAGKAVAPLAAKAGAYAPYAAGLTSGVAAGGATGALSEEGDVGTGAAIGGAVGLASPMVGNIIQKGGGWATDLVRGRAGQVKAGQIARAAAGDQLPAIRQAMANADPSITAAQAGEGVSQPMWSALGKVAEGMDPSGYYYNTAQKQAAARAAALKNVTPDVAAAESARKATTNSLYKEAFEFKTKADTELAQMASDPYFKEAQNAVLKQLESKGITFRDKPIEYLHNIKLGYDKLLSRTGDTALASSEKAQVAQQKALLMNWIEKKSKPYEMARSKFAEMSAPVNQGKVLGELSSVLTDPKTVGERTGPFLTAMGRGEDAALTRAGLNARFGGIEDVLTPEQMGAVKTVSGELTRDASIKAQAAAGAGGLRDVIEKYTTNFKLPGFMSRETTAFNKVLEMSEKYLSESTKKALVEGMKSGKSVTELLDTLPTSEKNKFLMLMGQVGQKAAPYLAAQAGSME